MGRTRNIEAELNVAEETPVEETNVEKAVEEPNVPDETEKPSPTEKKPEPKVNTGEKGVKIRLIEDVDCFIGKNHYDYAKGKEAIVPSDVAAILCSSQKAIRF